MYSAAIRESAQSTTTTTTELPASTNNKSKHARTYSQNRRRSLRLRRRHGSKLARWLSDEEVRSIWLLRPSAGRSRRAHSLAGPVARKWPASTVVVVVGKLNLQLAPERIGLLRAQAQVAEKSSLARSSKQASKGLLLEEPLLRRLRWPRRPMVSRR